MAKSPLFGSRVNAYIPPCVYETIPMFFNPKKNLGLNPKPVPLKKLKTPSTNAHRGLYPIISIKMK